MSLGVQLATVALLAAFFVALTRPVRLQEVRLWAAAWTADAVALTAVFLGSVLTPPSPIVRVFICVYIAGKTTYALLLISGAQNHLRPGVSEPLRPGWLALVVAAWSVALAVFAPKLVEAQVATYLVVGGVLSVGAVWVLRTPRFSRSRWLGLGLLVEGLLFLHYVPMRLPQLWGHPPLASYVYYSSFFDAGAELLVALAILVVVESSFSEHLEHLNGELVASQERLRQLVDLDPLTSLSNRRRLREEFDRAKPEGATVVFLDIDDFKGINDRFGHIVGDACLRRLAVALGRVFRTDDALLRLGGDEFLIVAPGLDADAARDRISRMRRQLAVSEDGVPPCRFSAGIVVLAPHGEPEAALREADEKMYREKRLKKGSRALHHGGVFSRLTTEANS